MKKQWRVMKFSREWGFAGSVNLESPPPGWSKFQIQGGARAGEDN